LIASYVRTNSNADASVTQSALEEALASKMGDGAGTIASLRGTIGNAFRGRYMPKTNYSTGNGGAGGGGRD